MSEEIEEGKQEVDVKGIKYIRVEIPFDKEDIQLGYANHEKVVLLMSLDGAFSLGSKLVAADYDA